MGVKNNNFSLFLVVLCLKKCWIKMFSVPTLIIEVDGHVFFMKHLGLITAVILCLFQ